MSCAPNLVFYELENSSWKIFIHSIVMKRVPLPLTKKYAPSIARFSHFLSCPFFKASLDLCWYFFFLTLPSSSRGSCRLNWWQIFTRISLANTIGRRRSVHLWFVSRVIQCRTSRRLYARTRRRWRKHVRCAPLPQVQRQWIASQEESTRTWTCFLTRWSIFLQAQCCLLWR